MRNLKRRIFATLLTLTILICSFGTNAFAATHGFKWSSTPVTVYATPQFSSYEISQLKSAISIWNSTRVGTVITYGGVRSSVIVLETMELIRLEKLHL